MFKILSVFLIFSVLVNCTTQPKTTVNELPLQTIAVGELIDLKFSKSMAQPEYILSDLQEFRCDIKKDIHAEGDKLKNGSNEQYIHFLCFHYQKYFSKIDNIFDRKINYLIQKNYQNIQLLWGDANYQTSPSRYIVRRDLGLDSTVIYHELGHRVFELIEEDLKINLGGPGAFLHMGLLDYFTTSIADNPMIGASLLPVDLQRNVLKAQKYPEGIMTIVTLAKRFKNAYKNEFIQHPYHETFYLMFKNQSKKDRNMIESHMSGLVIAKPLWELRDQWGSETIDTLVGNSILRLSDLKQLRVRNHMQGLDKENSQKSAQWFDLILAISEVANEKNNKLCKSVVTAFENNGFETSNISPKFCL